jgi:hypothetical protein
MPDRIGVVDAYTLLYVDGHVEVVPGVDIVDHIEFLAATPAAFDFRIDALSAYGDVDVTVYDPVADVVVGVFAVSGSVEYGRVVVHQANRPFQLIIEAYQYDTFWSLELVGDFYSGFLASTSGPRAGGHGARRCPDRDTRHGRHWKPGHERARARVPDRGLLHPRRRAHLTSIETAPARGAAQGPGAPLRGRSRDGRSRLPGAG